MWLRQPIERRRHRGGADVGFGDLSTFNHRFRTLFGVAPARFRRGSWENSPQATRSKRGRVSRRRAS
jgi:AraC-like DNA-binding protein